MTEPATAPAGHDLVDRWTGGPGRDIDGVPWPRTAVEVFGRFREISDLTLAVTRGQATLPDDSNGGMTAVLRGAYACGAWTLGLRWDSRPWPLSPVTLTAEPPSGTLLWLELTEANRIVETRSDRWPWCLGVVRWLGWVTGHPAAEEPIAFFR